MRGAWAAAVLATALFAGDAGAKCAMQVLDDEVITHKADEIPASGGVLVGWTSNHASEDVDGDPVVHPGWRFTERKKKVRTTMTLLAPGLAVYAPKLPRNKAHTVRLVGDGGKTIGTYKFAKQVRKSFGTAPLVKAVRHAEDKSMRWDEISDTADLDAAPPAGAYGLIMYKGDVALSWRAIEDPAATSMIAYQSEGHCGVLPPGMQGTTPGDVVTFAWVDRFGQLSPRSTEVKVQ